MDMRMTQQLQAIEHQLQQVRVHIQSVKAKLMEVDSAISAVEQTDTAYKAIANILVLQKPEELKKQLIEDKEQFLVRVSSFEKQEQKLLEQKKELQEKIMQQGDTRDK